MNFYQEKYIYSLKALKSQLLQVNENPAADAGVVDIGKMEETQVETQGEHGGEKYVKAAAYHGVEVVFTEAEVELCEFAASSQKSIGREPSEFGPEFDGRTQAVQPRLFDPVPLEFKLEHGHDGAGTGRQAIAKAGRLADGAGDQSRVQG